MIVRSLTVQLRVFQDLHPFSPAAPVAVVVGNFINPNPGLSDF